MRSFAANQLLVSWPASSGGMGDVEREEGRGGKLTPFRSTVLLGLPYSKPKLAKVADLFHSQSTMHQSVDASVHASVEHQLLYRQNRLCIWKPVARR